MSATADYVKHVQHTHADQRGDEAWCGVTVTKYDLPFESIDHAAYSRDGRLLPCPRCVAAITQALRREN